MIFIILWFLSGIFGFFILFIKNFIIDGFVLSYDWLIFNLIGMITGLIYFFIVVFLILDNKFNRYINDFLRKDN